MRRSHTSTLFLLLLCFCCKLGADELVYQVRGVEGALAENVLAAAQPFRLTGNRRMTQRRLEVLADEAAIEAALALRPLGYYQATATAKPVRSQDGTWQIELTVDPGQPVLIDEVVLELTGPGASDSLLQDWKAEFPLKPNQVLNQVSWETQKSLALEQAALHGFLSARFAIQRLDLDLVKNRANLHLQLDTGSQAVMGDIRFEQDAVREGILDLLPRWTKGQAYDQWLLEQFRLDLWRTGYFETINVLERRALDESPPTVDLDVQLEARNKNTYQGSLGYGTDSGVRLHAMWRRHLLSSRGDTLDIAAGWQQRDNKYSLRAAYRLPRATTAHEFWTADATYRSEKQDLLVRPNDGSEELIRIARGNTNDYIFSPGLLKVRNLDKGYQRVFEHWFVRYLNEKPDFSLVTDGEQTPDEFFPQDAGEERSQTWAPGVSWDWPVVHGSGFETVGHRSGLTAFTSQTAWGSDLDFSQIYLSSAFNRLLGSNWKLLLRGEIGWSDADLRDITIDTGDASYDLSVTELPYAYRFKAGGSRSVRGYGFESLSNNNIGSNNIITLSTELEYRFHSDWSVAGFFDAGNAFNDWSDARLKKGYGLGIRWYSIAGAVRLDVAQGVDEPGKPWRIHFTIGTPLL